MTMNFGGSSEPRATDRNEPMPSFSQALRSSTSTSRPCVLTMASACSPRKVGVAKLAGRFAHSRARFMPETIAAPMPRPVFAVATAALGTT